jgi:hypothetical protein
MKVCSTLGRCRRRIRWSSHVARSAYTKAGLVGPHSSPASAIEHAQFGCHLRANARDRALEGKSRVRSNGPLGSGLLFQRQRSFSVSSAIRGPAAPNCEAVAKDRRRLMQHGRNIRVERSKFAASSAYSDCRGLPNFPIAGSKLIHADSLS